ncbi:GNAT family N-acetyltransferase [Streptomyces sp. FXJ1.172]|uniref:GNAT family N-acetyltransferase n=1 Tax=Streptomyces sp. FXJ1.172 TaxID=710705 RepID=UPI0007CFDF7D|nr:GNAT family N-acetyltransferase [Streptomyces sp. FXJ1.172]WEO96818.1 GNAT family N-acetyltransferase [Streptomyces sp. FXJ1.172]
MSPENWYLTEDLDEFLARAGGFLHSRPAPHTVALTVTDALRRRGPHVFGPEDPVFGVLEDAPDEGGAGAVRAVLLHTPPFPLHVTALTPAGADALAARLADLDRAVPGVSGPQETAQAFAAAWQRRTGAAGTVQQRQRLYRLAELTVPEPAPEGRARLAVGGDRELLARWYREFAGATAQEAGMDPAEWADTRIAHDGVTLWETPDGTPVSMAGTTPEIAGQVRIARVYTPAGLRGRGYAGAATAEASRVAREAGAAEVLLFTDLANPTSNALYQRIGYRPVADSTVWRFGDSAG